MPETDQQAATLSVGFVNLGCAKNLVDSQVMAGAMLSEGIALAPSPEEADVVLVNTCSFIQDARDESFDAIEAACDLKRAGNCRYVVVTGCLPQRYRDEIFSHHPDIDAIAGLDELEDVPRLVTRLVSAQHPIAEVCDTPTRTFEPRVPGLVFTGGPYAYLKIAEGCNHTCAFCAIPEIRGRQRSRTADDIVREAAELLAAGYRELNVISQDITSYGRDLDNGLDLAGLLRELDALGSGFWIRLLYGYPAYVTDDLLDTIGELDTVCPYLDIPVQHSHPDILRAMRRANTTEAVTTLAPRVRARLPGAVLRTTCLVGFPGETEAHFQHLLDYVTATRFDHLGAFVFSPEDGTPAATMASTPALDVAEARRERLLLAQRAVIDERNAAWLGAEDDVLLEAPPADADAPWRGRTPRFAPEVDGDVWIDNVPTDCAPGDMVRARYTDCRDYDMLATYVSG